MSAGVCSIVKSKPRQLRVRHCISNSSLDVHGAVTVEKVWLAEGDTLQCDQQPTGSTDIGCLGSRKNHHWSLYTNLSCTQQCLKCEKRILTKRAAYKCTVCKKLSHLKCAVNNQPVAARTRSRTKYQEHKLTVTKVPQIGEYDYQSLRATREQPEHDSNTDLKTYYHTEESDSLAEFIMEENNCKADCSTQTQNTTVQSQAKQTLCNMRTNFVRRCKSIKKKVEKLRDKLNCDNDEQPNNGANALQEVPDDGADVIEEEAATSAREAWLCSPVRKRLRSRLRDDKDSEIEELKTDWVSFKRKNTRKRRLHSYNLELTLLNDRLEVVERKIGDLEKSIPQEIEEWRNLQKKYEITDRYGSNNVDSKEPLIVHDAETAPRVPLVEDNLPSISSVTTSGEMGAMPGPSYGCHGDTSRKNLNQQTDSSARVESFPSTIPPRLFIDDNRDTAESCSMLHQTSTPVANKEITYRSATKTSDNLSELTHKNITHIKMGNVTEITDGENADSMNSEKIPFPDSTTENKILSPNQLAVKSFLERRHSSITESKNRISDTEPEAKVLSPNQIAVQKFLERRKSSASSEFVNNSRIASHRLSSPGTGNDKAVLNSPTNNIASSTFTNGVDDILNPFSNMSPIPFTCKNGFDSGAVSISRSSEDLKSNDRRTNGLDRSAFNMSALSYTFRNDSSMVHTDANENLPGFSDNLIRCRQDINSGHLNSPRQNFDVQPVFSAIATSPNENAASTAEGLSLTDVTEFSPDCPNSFAENKDKRPKGERKESTGSRRFSDEFLTQIKSGVKLKDTSFEIKEEVHVDQKSESSELKLVYDRIVKRDKVIKSRHNGKVNFLTEDIKIDETGDNGHRAIADIYKRKNPYSKLGSKYHDLFRFCNLEQSDNVTDTYGLVRELVEHNGDENVIQKRSPPLPPKPEKAVVKTERRDIENSDLASPASEATGNTQKLDFEKDKIITVEASPAVDAAGDKNMAALENEEIKNNIAEAKSETFPRTVKKHYDLNHLAVEGIYEKAASYAGSLDIDRRSVYTETGSLDRHGDAKYHFLHEKGMIKICSPRLELVSESPSSKRKFQTVADTDNHISEEDTNVMSSSSEMSGVVIDNEFHLNDNKERLEDFNEIIQQTETSEACHIKNEGDRLPKNSHADQTTESVRSEIQMRQQDLANDILENCLEMIDNNQATLDHVFDWINNDCNNNSDQSVKAELDAIVDADSHAQSPIDDSVYYSFQGQSEEIRKMMTELETDNKRSLQDDQLIKDFLVAVMNENNVVVSEFCKSGNAIPEAVLKEALDYAIQQQNRLLAKALLDYGCNILLNMALNGVVDVLPAYLINDEWNPVFIVLRKSESEKMLNEFLGYRVYNRKYNEVNEEAAATLKSDLIKTNPLSFNDIEKLKQAVDKINLHDHSNITVINFCPFRSRKSGEEIVLETCIVIHVLVKGLIPFNEKPFPESILGIPVDVREGYFTQGVQRGPYHETIESCTEISDTTELGSISGEDDSVRTSTSLATGSQVETSGTDAGVSEEQCSAADVDVDYYLGQGEYHTDDNVDMQQEAIKKTDGSANTLKMGACIYGPDDTGKGSLGGFIPIKSDMVGFLTCAHVVGLESGRSVYVECRDEENPQSVCRNVCGEVTRSVCQPGSASATGVDAAVVAITSDLPDRAEFIHVTEEELKATGFDGDHLPTFHKGKILTLDELGQCWAAHVTKVGATTGLTKGLLYSYGTYIRQLNQERKGKQSLELYNQLEILPANHAMKFFDLGDSGALVFMHLNDHDLYCIGLAVGCTSYGSCIVTPIEPVLKELDLPNQFCSSQGVE